MSDDINAKADRMISDLLCWARQFGARCPEVEENLRVVAREYRDSPKWKYIPKRFPDSIDCPPVSGEFEAK